MQSLELFKFNGQEVGVTVDENGNPWWIASDVARVLGFNHTPHMVRGLDADEKGVRKVDTLGGDQQVTTINESGLYSVILKSRKPEAKAFKRWVTHEVLPSIRKHGAYINPRVVEHQMMASLNFDKGRMELLQAAKGLIRDEHLEAMATALAQKALGTTQAPIDLGADAILYASDFLQSLGLSEKERRRRGGVFGKRLKKRYIETYGTEPKKYMLTVGNGQVRPTNAYCEKDRPMMQQVWDEMLAEARA